MQLDLRQIFDRGLTPEQRQKIIEVYRLEIAGRVRKLREYQQGTALPEKVMICARFGQEFCSIKGGNRPFAAR